MGLVVTRLASTVQRATWKSPCLVRCSLATSLTGSVDCREIYDAAVLSDFFRAGHSFKK